MKVAFFLTLKEDVVYLQVDATMRQALERMEYHRFSAVPLLDHAGHYVGTLTEGDLLWKMKHTENLSFGQTQNYRLADVPRHVNNEPVHIDAEMEEVLSKALAQNFVPVVDSRDVFIGIVRRRDLIQYCLKLVQEKRAQWPLTAPAAQSLNLGPSLSPNAGLGPSLAPSLSPGLSPGLRQTVDPGPELEQ